MRSSALVLGALLLVAGATSLGAQTPKRRKVGPDGAPVRLLQPGERPSAVTTQAAAAPAVASGAFTAGLAISPYAGTSDADLGAYVARFTQLFDSAVVSLVNVFRNTTGQPVTGAESPTALSQRERDRWARCRDLHFDLQTYQAAFHDLLPRLPQTGNVPHTSAALDSALAAIEATAECDNISSMIEAPGRWSPWSTQYESSAQHFYRDWYTEVREADDHNRAFVVAFNAARPSATRIPVPPALPRTPPYIGAGPR